MRPFDRHRATVLGWFPAVLTVARARGLTESAARLTAAEQRLREGRLTAVVCGEFKRGKSSLLNALLEEPEPFLFPVETTFATSIVSTVTHGPKERIIATLEVEHDAPAVVATPGGRPDSENRATTEEREITRAEIAEYVTESANPHNTKKARSIAIDVPNSKLESGLALVDTPGVGGVYAEHTAVTLGFLPTADAIVFVADATQPLTESELVFLRNAAASTKVTDDQDGLLFVLTKIDLVDYTGILENMRGKLADVTGRPPADIEITPVSAHAKLKHLANGDLEYLELSNFPALEDRIWGALSRRRTTLLLGGALTELDGTATALLEPLQAELKALKAETPAKVAAMVADAERREAEFARLRADNAGWRRDLEREITACRTTLERVAARQVEEIWDRVDTEFLYDEQYLDDPELLVRRVTEAAALVVGEVNELAARQVAAIQQHLADRSGLSIQRRRLGSLPPPPLQHVELTGRLGEAPDSRMRTVRDMSFGGGLGFTIGSLVGHVIVPGLGGIIGGAIGSLFGAGAGFKASRVAAHRQDVEARRRSLRTELKPVKRGQVHHVQDAVRELLASFEAAVVAELKSRVTEAKESAQDEARRLRAAKEATEQAARARKAALTREITPLVRLRSDVEAMARRIAQPEPPRPETPPSGPPQSAAPPSAGRVEDDAAEDWADE